jgi:hypothetical protein
LPVVALARLNINLPVVALARLNFKFEKFFCPLKNASRIRAKSEEKSSQIFTKKLGEKIGFHHPIFLIMA